ncbi:EamA family transporter [Archangium lansingense]|uniref:EamA family transporter n=1 Tax=Archangium lansingense TaxID=2995310 RepID=UPI003B7DA341
MSEGPSVRSPLTLPPIPAVLIAILSVQGGAALAKGLFPALGPAGTAGLRICLAALLLLAVFRPPLTRFTREQWAAVLPYGVVLGAMNLSFYLALARIPLGLAVTLEFLGPLGLAVLGSRHLSDFLWVALAAAGIVLLAPWSGRADALDLWGVLLAVFAGACWAAYIVLGGRVSRRLPHGQSVAAGMMIAALTVLPFTLTDVLAARFTPTLMGAALGVAVLSSALPYTLEMMALRSLPSRTFGILMSLEPAVAALMGLLVLGEQLSGLQWVAIVCVSAASAGSTLTASRVRPPVDA